MGAQHELSIGPDLQMWNVVVYSTQSTIFFNEPKTKQKNARKKHIGWETITNTTESVNVFLHNPQGAAPYFLVYFYWLITLYEQIYKLYSTTRLPHNLQLSETFFTAEHRVAEITRPTVSYMPDSLLQLSNHRGILHIVLWHPSSRISLDRYPGQEQSSGE